MSNIDVNSIIPPEAQAEIKRALSSCYACNRCTSGCPVATEMDYPPSLLIRSLALGSYKSILSSKAIWLCTSCQTCRSRCPFEINIPLIIDRLKEHAYQSGISEQERSIKLFHMVFLANIKLIGRIFEPGFIGVWKLLSGKLFNDLALGGKMFFKGKLPLVPKIIKHRKKVREIFAAAKKKGES